MPEMRQRVTVPHREIRRESRTKVLGMLGVSQVPDEKKSKIRIRNYQDGLLVEAKNPHHQECENFKSV